MNRGGDRTGWVGPGRDGVEMDLKGDGAGWAGDEMDLVGEEMGFGRLETVLAGDIAALVEDEVGLVGDKAGLVGDETGLVGDKTGLVGDEIGLVEEGSGFGLMGTNLVGVRRVITGMVGAILEISPPGSALTLTGFFSGLLAPAVLRSLVSSGFFSGEAGTLGGEGLVRAGLVSTAPSLRLVPLCSTVSVGFLAVSVFLSPSFCALDSTCLAGFSSLTLGSDFLVDFGFLVSPSFA